MIRKYHNHTLQTNPRHRTFTVTRHPKGTKSKTTSSFFIVKMIAKLERKQSNALTETKTNQQPSQTMGETKRKQYISAKTID